MGLREHLRPKSNRWNRNGRQEHTDPSFLPSQDQSVDVSELHIVTEQPRSDKEQKEIQSFLRTKYKEQKRNIDKGAFEPFLTKKTKTLFPVFQQSDFFKEVYAEAAIHVGTIVNDEEFRKSFVGYSFAKLAFGMLSAELDSNEVILSSDATFQLMRKLHPEVQVFEYPFERTSLEGIYVPDGIKINSQGKISEVFEYTLSNSARKMESQHTGYRHLAQALPDVFVNNSKFTLVVPSSDEKAEIEEKYSDIMFRQLPFNRNEFAEFTETVFTKYRAGENKATLHEARGWRNGETVVDFTDQTIPVLAKGKLKNGH